MIKAKLLVENNDLSYLFLDTDNAEPDAQPVEISIHGVNFSDIEDEDKVVWLSNSKSQLSVILREDYDFLFDNMKDYHQIPSPFIVFDRAEYKRLRDELP